MRKRAQRKSRPTTEKPKHLSKSIPSVEKKTPIIRKNWIIPIALVSIFFIVLFFNSYFNVTSGVAYNEDGEGWNKYYLSGPDPYYNLRMVKGTYETGKYPYYSEVDPLLNYPEGARGGRPPLFNMMSLGFSRLLTPFMGEIDAVGRAMQFVPALFGALLVFPVYYIGKTLFNKKAGLIAAFFLAIIPAHIGSGHGSAYSLFDHDSFNLLLFFSTFCFLILSVKEKNTVKSILYAILAGVPLAGLTMTWVEARFLYVVIAAYAVVQMVIDIFTNKIEVRVFRSSAITLLSGYLISLPVIYTWNQGFSLETSLIMALAVIAVGILYYIFKVKNIPWTISLPTLFILGAGGLFFLYIARDISSSFPILSNIKGLSNIVFGSGIYGNKVSMTIAEAGTYQISHTVMSFGPALYWMGFGGFIMLMWYYYKDNSRRDYLFIIYLFIVDLWLAGTAGRFINDMAPLIALLAGWLSWIIISKIDYKQMIRNIKSAGSGFHGLRRGIKILHIVGILFFAFIVIFPNVFITLDAAVPNYAYQEENETGGKEWTNYKWEVFGTEHSGAFGLGISKERYWSNAFTWLSEQDTDLEPKDRPGFISWWDYGFYEVAIGDHPTVADNFQHGIPPASNFHTALSEKDAVTVWIVRVLEGNSFNNKGVLTEEVKAVLKNHLDENNSAKIISWIENPEDEEKAAPSYGKKIDEEYHEYMRSDVDPNLLTVGAQWAANAYYHDIVDLFNNETHGLTEEEVTWLYHDLQDATGYSIRYYGVEGYDRQIFNIFAFLSDKSLVLLGTPDDEFVNILYSGYEVDPVSRERTRTINNEPFIDYLEMDDIDKRYIAVTGTSQEFKDNYFDTMFYKTYIGFYDIDSESNQKSTPSSGQVPCLNMKHFYGEYISDVSDVYNQYLGTGRAAVVIAKYYEGAYVNGTVYFQGEPLNRDFTVSVRKNLAYSPGANITIDHDEYLINGSDKNDTFKVLAGAGSYIAITRNPELRNYQYGIAPFEVATVKFNDNDSTSEYARISEKDAMREENSNYERLINITINPANITGFVYNDLDNDGKYNVSEDQSLNNATIVIYEINEFNQDALNNPNNPSLVPIQEKTPLAGTAQVNETGNYVISDLMPGWYAVNTYLDDYLIAQDILPLRSGNTSHNISKPKPSRVKGIVYYDENGNELYDNGEQVEDATVNLKYPAGLTGEKTVDTTITDSTGSYEFMNLTPGEYNIQATSTYYQTVTSVQLKENKTNYFNVSMALIPVTVNGYTMDVNGKDVGNVDIVFSVNESVEDNTAEETQVTTDVNGSYSIELQPGSYNISGLKTDENTIIYILENETLSLAKGQNTGWKNLTMTKKSVTVTGTTSYNDESIDDISINFENDEAMPPISTTVISDENGTYSIELSPGSYNITSESEIFNISGVNYSYYWNYIKEFTEDEIATGVTLNIALERREED